MTPKLFLSALFNIPTLTAYREGADYFYILNDDVILLTPKWTEHLIEPLETNKLFKNLGVSGGNDVSDTFTPQIEFPFFHRTHVI